MIGHTLQEADLSLHASSFVSKNFLLIHGTADICVHQQHTMLLTKSLIQKGVIFRHQVSCHRSFWSIYFVTNGISFVRFTPMKTTSWKALFIMSIRRLSRLWMTILGVWMIDRNGRILFSIFSTRSKWLYINTKSLIVIGIVVVSSSMLLKFLNVLS